MRDTAPRSRARWTRSSRPSSPHSRRSASPSTSTRMNLASFHELCRSGDPHPGMGRTSLLFEADGPRAHADVRPLGTAALRPSRRRAPRRGSRAPAACDLQPLRRRATEHRGGLRPGRARRRGALRADRRAARGRPSASSCARQQFAPETVAVVQDRDSDSSWPAPSARPSWWAGRSRTPRRVARAGCGAGCSRGPRCTWPSPPRRCRAGASCSPRRSRAVEAPLRRGAWQILAGAALAAALAGGLALPLRAPHRGRGRRPGPHRPLGGAWRAREPLRTGVTEVNEWPSSSPPPPSSPAPASRKRGARAAGPRHRRGRARPRTPRRTSTPSSGPRWRRCAAWSGADTRAHRAGGRGGAARPALLHRRLHRDAAGLRDREGPGYGRPGLVHRPAGAHRRLRRRPRFRDGPLPAHRDGRRHRVLPGGADRHRGRGGGRDLRQQLACGRSPRETRRRSSPSPTTRRWRCRRPGSSPPSTRRARRRRRPAAGRTSSSPCSATSCATRSPRSPPPSTCSSAAAPSEDACPARPRDHRAPERPPRPAGGRSARRGPRDLRQDRAGARGRSSWRGGAAEPWPR